MKNDRKFLGDMLEEKGLVKRADLEEALKEQSRTHRPLGSVLIERNYITEEQLLMVLAEQMGYQYVNLTMEPISVATFNIIPIGVCKEHNVVAVSKDGGVLKVAMVDPLDLNAMDAVQEATGMRVQPVFATNEKIKDKISELSSEHDEKMKKIHTEGTGATQPTGNDEMQEALQGSVIKLVNQMIEKAVYSRASDIHLDPEEKDLACKMRVDGILMDVEMYPESLKPAIISRVKIMSGMDIAEKRLPQDGRVNVKIKDKDIDLRIATFPTVWGEKLSMRILDKSKGILALKELGMGERELQKFEKIINKPYGIIFVCGPTGAGKSTTLYSVLNIVDRVRNNVMTLEDPVEYLIPRVKQSQINIKAGLTFANGLRAILRQDPDVIMIGEVRDRETAEIAIHSALTGHLVFSTIHTNDASSAVARLVDMDIEPFLISSSLIGVLSQRLVRQLCTKCKKKSTNLPEELLKKFGIAREDAAGIHEPVGCKECNMTGYSGRVGLFELLTITDVLRENIIKKASQHELKKLAIEQGMRPLMVDAVQKVLDGKTSFEEILVAEASE